MKPCLARRSLVLLVVVCWSVLGVGSLFARGAICVVPRSICDPEEPACAKLTSLWVATDTPVTLDPGVYNNGSPCGFNPETKLPCGGPIGNTLCNEGAINEGCGIDDPLCLGDPGDGGGGGPFGPCGEGEEGCADAKSPQKTINARLGELANVSLPPAAEVLLRTYAQAKTLHFKARSLIVVTPATNRPGGTALTPYEFWAKGNQFRIHTALDPRLGITGVTDLAFDGQHYQLMMLSGLEKLLSLSLGNTHSEPLTVQNPLFAPFAFLSLHDDQTCPTCALQLADLAKLYSLRKAAPAGAPAAATAAQTFAVPGGALHGATQFEVALDSAGRISSIRHLSAQGQVLESYEISNYTLPAGAAAFPRSITETRYDAQGKAWYTAKYSIDQVDFNGAIDDAQFVIPRSEASDIWDGTTGRWLKRSDLTATGLCKQH